MSRSGYSDDCDCDSPEAMWAWIRHCGALKSTIRGGRGQAFLVDLVRAMDALPNPRLVAEKLETPAGEVCALGAVGRARGIDMTAIATEDWKRLSEEFGITELMAREIMYLNDEWCVSDEERFRYIRRWALRHIKAETLVP
jgi:hypothetical protein